MCSGSRIGQVRQQPTRQMLRTTRRKRRNRKPSTDEWFSTAVSGTRQKALTQVNQVSGSAAVRSLGTTGQHGAGGVRKTTY